MSGSTTQQWLIRTVLLMGTLAMVSLSLMARDYLVQPDTLPLKKIKVQGELRHLDRQELIDTVAAAIDGGFFIVDIDAIKDEVESLPWVEKASIRRHWPDTLAMTVVEQQPFARWGKGALVNPMGQIFTPKQLQVTAKATLFGPDNRAEAVVAFYKQVVKQVQLLGLSVKRMGMDRRQEWSFILDNDLKVVLGHEQSAIRLQRFFDSYPLLVSAGKTPIRIDMRYGHGLSVLWREDDVADAERGNT